MPEPGVNVPGGDRRRVSNAIAGTASGAVPTTLSRAIAQSLPGAVARFVSSAAGWL